MMKKFTNFKQQAKLLLCLLTLFAPREMLAAGSPMTIPEVIWCEDNNTLYFVMGTAYGSGEFDDETGEELIYEYEDVAGGRYRSPVVANPLNFKITAIWYGDDVLNTGSVSPGWLDDYSSKIKHVVIDATFARFCPKSCYSWFSACMQLEDITGLGNLNTSQVTSMYGMFDGCKSLTSLDVSSFNTANVTNMGAMFRNCSALTSLDLSKFDTSKVTNMYAMFEGCSALASLDVSKFDTSKVTNMYAMFEGCSSLTSLDVSNFDTSNVTDMGNMFCDCSSLTSLDVSSFDTSEVTAMDCMFYDCSSLTSLDLSNFDTSEVTSMDSMFFGCIALTSLDLSNFDTSEVTAMDGMFYGCSSLITIFCDKIWTTTDSSSDMFADCTSLVGGAGTVFNDENPVDATYAHPDGGTTNPGYFTIPSKTPQAIWTADGTLTFVNAAIQYATVGTFNGKTVTAVYVTPSGNKAPAWNNNTVRPALTKVVFHRSFSSVRPTSLSLWFARCSKLTAIEGISNLNTSKVTDMSNMFVNCEALTSLDLSNFDTSNVTNMSNMLSGCSSLTSLDVSSFNTSKVTNMSFMFSSCGALMSLVLSNFNTGNVTNMSNMFFGCSALTSLELSNFNTGNVTNMISMFKGCSDLTSLDVSNFDTNKVTRMEAMFQGCSALPSLDLSNFDTRKVSFMSNMFDGCSALTSLDLSNFDTSIVAKMDAMFKGCSVLTSLDLSNFDTRKVAYMSNMFDGCSALTSLDLSNFDTSKVSFMSNMFDGCSNLTTIFCNDTWTPDDSSGNMFAGCTRLVGGAGTVFDSSHVDADYARPDGANQGYFTSSTKVITANKPDDKETYWTTYYNGGIHTQVIPAEGQTLTVYTAKLEEVEGVRQLKLTTVADNIIMAGQGVIIKSSHSDVTLKHSASLTPTGSYYSKNELKGRDMTVAVPTNEGTIYTMGNVGGKLGFYKYTGSQLKARRAYLAIPAGSEAGIRIRFDGEDTATGLDEVQSTTDKVQSTGIYDLQGRRVVNPTKGIYIVNGKKVYMK